MDEGEKVLQETQGVSNEADPLKLDLDDETFVEVMDDLIEKSRNHFKEQGLIDRRKKNEEYYLGKQIANAEKNRELKKYNARYSDNVIFEAAGTLKAVAISRVPDLLVKPGNETEESRIVAEELTDVINGKFRQRETRLTLGTAYLHRPIYFVGVVKARWDDEMGKDGDYTFDVVHPNNIDVDHTASSSNADDMNWVCHTYELTVKEILMRWPNKKEALFEELHWDDMTGSEEKKMASKLKISEIWFTWYKKENDKWVKLEGTAWKYKKVVFDKIKNPYWDWEGETRMFSYDVETKGKKTVSEQDIRSSLLSGEQIPNLGSEKIFHNHFYNPRKPFKFMVHEGLGLAPYDDTTCIEQSLYLQDNINVRGKQISELSALARGKSVFSTDSGLDSEDVARIDMADPNTDLLIDGDLSKVHTYIPGMQPTAALFQEQEQNRQRVFSKMGTNAALRGVRAGEDTATQTQLYKESDYTRIDDEVEDTVNATAEWMADWSLQFMKLFYTEEHLVRLVGENGQTVFQKLTRDVIEDGVEVKVSASSVDKLRRKKEAFDLVGIGMIDPVQFFRDIEASDPEGRARSLMLFQTQPQMYFQNYIEGRDTNEMVQQLGQMPVQGPPVSPEAQAMQPPEAPVPQAGMPPM
jgi:hypothetical protein